MSCQDRIVTGLVPKTVLVEPLKSTALEKLAQPEFDLRDLALVRCDE